MLPSLLGGCRGVSFTGPGCRLFWIFLTLGLLGLSTDVLAHAVALHIPAHRCQWPFILTHLWPIKLTHPS
jgi:hypothetical protein